jgi:hypothetical protein
MLSGIFGPQKDEERGGRETGEMRSFAINSFYQLLLTN